MSDDPPSLHSDAASKPRYTWPRYVIAGVILFLVATIIWVICESRKVEQQRDFSAPIQTK
jgi:hypothetical protein